MDRRVPSASARNVRSRWSAETIAIRLYIRAAVLATEIPSHEAPAFYGRRCGASAGVFNAGSRDMTSRWNTAVERPLGNGEPHELRKAGRLEHKTQGSACCLRRVTLAPVRVSEAPGEPPSGGNDTVCGTDSSNARLSTQTQTRWGRQVGLGLVFGAMPWLVNFQIVARLFYPWFSDDASIPSDFDARDVLWFAARLAVRPS